MSRNGRVLVAMSGGVDSSVAAALLREQGFDAVGVFMRTGVSEPQGGQECKTSLPLLRAERTRGCCSAVDAADARGVAARLGIPFYALNFRDDFERLMDEFADEYVRGRTPNPCVRCNQWLKFGRLVEYAKVVDAEWIATGHYAIVRRDSVGRARLMRAADRRKDQSYVLFGMARDVLDRTWFPLGELSKDDVRSEARRLGLPVFDKPESQDICFVPDGDYAAVVERRRPGAMQPGVIRHVDGRIVGRHQGVGTLTIGQRRGVRVAAGTPVYVTELDAESATVTVGPREMLSADGLVATQVNWLADLEDGPLRADVQIRYHHEAAPATVSNEGNGVARVAFDKPAEAVTPGQAAVFYRGDEVIGGGWIERAIGTCNRDASPVVDRHESAPGA